MAIDFINTSYAGKGKNSVSNYSIEKNTIELLDEFDIMHIFDLILTQEDIARTKPDPEGFLNAMQYFEIDPKRTIIFEDSEVGIKAAIASGAQCFVTKGYN